MRFGNVPLAEFRGLVAMRAEEHFQIDCIRFQCRRKFQFGGCIVSRVAAKNQQQVDFAGAHVFNQRVQRLASLYGVCIDRFGVENRLANITKRIVHCMR